MTHTPPHSFRNTSSPSESFISQLIEDISQFASYSIEYKKYLSNHTTHYVVAFAGLKDRFPSLWTDTTATQRLESFCNYYQEKLESRGSVVKSQLDKIKHNEQFMWRNLHNIVDTKTEIHNEYETVLQYMQEMEQNEDLIDWKEKANTKQILNRFIPYLVQGISGAAFHGLIETGWRIEGGFCLAPGISYMIVRGLDMGAPRPLPELSEERHSNPVEILRRVTKDEQFDRLFDGASGGFQVKMQRMAKSPDLLNDYDLYLPENTTYEKLEQLCEAINEELYRIFTRSTAKGDFFVLHTITALHAVRNILARLEKQKHQVSLVRNFWRSIVAAYCVLGRPQLVDGEKNNVPPDWKKQIERADQLPHLDEHWYKLFFVSVLTEERVPRLGNLMREAVDLYYNVVSERDSE